jgi:hypothetical protein
MSGQLGQLLQQPGCLVARQKRAGGCVEGAKPARRDLGAVRRSSGLPQGIEMHRCTRAGPR